MKIDEQELRQQLHPLTQTALVIVDIQNDFCAQGGYMNRERNYSLDFIPEVVGNIRRLIDTARLLGMPVVWVRSIYDFKYLAKAHISKRKHEGCVLEGSWGADFYEISPEPGEVIVDKHHFSGFHDTDLHQRLQALGVKTLLMTGVATNVCVDSTLRDGFFLDYHIVLVEDCVGSNSPVGHEGTLATVRNNIGTVIRSDALVSLLEESQP